MSRGRKSFEERLAEAVARLALPGERALEAGCGADRLAFDFDESYTDYISHLVKLPTDSQLQSLQALDSALSAMSGPEHSELWSESALKTDPRWQEIRALARVSLERFEWSIAH